MPESTTCSEPKGHTPEEVKKTVAAFHHTVITRKKDKGNAKITKTLLSDKYLAVLEIIFLTLPCCAALRDQTKQLSRKIKTIS